MLSQPVPWFALRTKSQHEKSVSAALRGKGYTEYLPLLDVSRRHHGGIRHTLLPLFPSYVFCRLDIYFRLPVLTIPGVLHFVGLGKIPVSVPEEEIAAVQQMLHSGLSCQPWPFVHVGQRVRIKQGPLCGMEGILQRFKSDYRLVVSVSMLQRSVAVEVMCDWVSPLAENRRLPESCSLPSPVLAEPRLPPSHCQRSA